MTIQLKSFVVVSVHSLLRESFSIKLNLDDGLPKIREKLAGKMDKKQLFLNKDESKIQSEDEKDFVLKDIVKKDSDENYQLNLSSAPKNVVTVSVHSTLREPFLAKLKLNDSLSSIRRELKMDRMLLFLAKDSFIPFENEANFKLSEIVKIESPEETCKIYLKAKVWEYLNEKYSLDYGCRRSKTTDYEISRAKKRAFMMKDCKFSCLSCPNYFAVKNNNEGHQMEEKSLSFNVDPGMVGSLGISGNKGNGTKTSSFDETIYYSKAILEFEKYLEPIDEFIKEVNEIKNSKKFSEIIENYGQFIPTKIIMGGKIHKEGDETSKNKSKSYSVSAGINVPTMNIGAGISSSDSKESASYYTKELFDGIGKSDDEESRNESLNDEKNWICVRYENQINIFELLTKNPKHKYLREKIFLAFGQRILYSNIEICDYTLNGCKPYFGEFKTIPSDVLKNRNDFYIFATILDAKGKKNDFFNCQIWFPDGRPNYIIHCFHRPLFSMTLDKKCELKIKYMVIGNFTDFNSINYDKLDSDIQLEVIRTNYNDNQSKCSNAELLGVKSNPSDNFIGIPVFLFKEINLKVPIIGHHFYTDHGGNVGVCTFSYSLDQKKYVNLPNFNFYTLKISNLIREKFDYKNICEKYSQIKHPKYFSLSSEEIYGPIFLKYTSYGIKLKVVNCECKCCGVCQTPSKISKERIDFVYFDF